MGKHQGEVGQIDNAFNVRHSVRCNLRGHHVTHEQELGFRMVHDVVNLLGIELVKDGNSNGTVGQRGEE